MSNNEHVGELITGWRKRQVALEIKAENARAMGLDYEPDKTVIEMARRAGMVYREFEDEFANANTDGVDSKTIAAFAELVASAEREKCAMEFDRRAKYTDGTSSSGWYEPDEPAQIIRNRGQV